MGSQWSTCAPPWADPQLSHYGCPCTSVCKDCTLHRAVTGRGGGGVVLWGQNFGVGGFEVRIEGRGPPHQAPQELRAQSCTRACKHRTLQFTRAQRVCGAPGFGVRNAGWGTSSTLHPRPPHDCHPCTRVCTHAHTQEPTGGHTQRIKATFAHRPLPLCTPTQPYQPSSTAILARPSHPYTLTPTFTHNPHRPSCTPLPPLHAASPLCTLPPPLARLLFSPPLHTPSNSLHTPVPPLAHLP